MTNNPQAASDEKILNAALEAGFRCHFAGIYHPLGHPRMNEHMARFAAAAPFLPVNEKEE